MASIKKNFVYSAILTVANNLFPLLTYPYVSRVLGVDNIGIVNFVDGIINYFCLFAMMGIESVGLREIAAARNDGQRLARVFNSLQALNVALMCLALGVLGLASVTIPKLEGYSSLLGVGALKIVFTCFLIQWFFKGIEDFKFITIRSVIVKFLYVIGVFVFVRSAADYNAYYALIVGSIGLNAAVNWAYARRHVGFRIKGLSLKGLTAPTMVLGVYCIFTSLYTSFNIVYLGFVSNDTQVGYYATATRLFTILLALYTAFTGVMMPRMSYLISEGRMDEFRDLARKSVEVLTAVSLPIVILFGLCAPEVVRVLSGPGYEGANLPMAMVMPLVFVIGYEQILVLQMLMPAKHDKVILRNSIAGAIVGVGLNLLLVGRLQAIGSAIVWVVCEVLILVLSQIEVSRRLGFAFPWRIVGKGMAAYLPLALLILAVRHLASGWLASPFVLLAVCGLITGAWFMAVQRALWPDGPVWQLVANNLKRLRRASAA